MADIFGSTDKPNWMNPSEFSLRSEQAGAQIGSLFANSFNSAANRKQQQDEFLATLPLKISEAKTINDARQAETAGQLLQNQQKQDALADSVIFGSAKTAWLQGDTSIEPDFKTIPAQSAWQTWKADTSLGKSIAEKNASFKEALSKLDGAGMAEVLKIPNNGLIPSREQWAALGREEERVKASKDYAPTETAKLIKELELARASGNKESAAFLEQKLAASTAGKRVYMGQDDQGRPIFEMTEGGAKSSVGDATVATKSDAQKSIIGLGKTVDLLSDIEKNIRPEDVGIRGTVGEMVVDRLLPQFTDNSPDLQRADNRTKLKAAIQGMVRQISSDTRFSEADRKRAEEAAPSSGMMESYPRLIQATRTLKDVFAQRARRDAEASGAPIPDFALTVKEIKGQFKAGKLTFDQAKELFTKYHPEALE